MRNNYQKTKIMKKLLFAIFCVATLSSCYNTRVLVGDVQPKEPLVKVNSEMNSHWLCGLISGRGDQAKEFVDGSTNYVIKTNFTFLDYIFSYVTFGIYTPNHTMYYIPLKDIKGDKK